MLRDVLYTHLSSIEYWKLQTTPSAPRKNHTEIKKSNRTTL